MIKRHHLFLTVLLAIAWLSQYSFIPAPRIDAAENIKTYAPTPVFTTLNGAINASVTSVVVVDATKLPAPPCRASVDNEYMYFVSVAGNTFTVGAPPENPGAATNGRGIEGSTAASHSSGASVRAPATAMTWLMAHEMATGIVTATNHGIVGDNSTDNLSALNALITNLSSSTVSAIYFPPGRYLISGTWDTSAKNVLKIEGPTWQGGDHTKGATITGTVAGPLVKFHGTSGRTVIRDVDFINLSTNAAAATLVIDNSNYSLVDSCQVSGNLGIDLSGGNGGEINHHIRNTVFNGSLSSFPNGIGLIMNGTGNTIIGCEFSGWAEGARLCNAGCSVIGGRLEVNKKGLRLGLDQNGNAFALARSTFAGISFEGNDTGISIEGGGVTGCTFSGIGMQGSTGSPAGQSITGIDVAGAMTDTTWDGCSPQGSYSTAAWRFGSGTINRSSLRSCEAANSLGTGKVWDVRVDLTGVDFDKSNYTVRLDDGVANPSLRRHGMYQYLSQIDYLTPSQEGKNLRGIGVTLGNGVTSKAIAFTGSGHGSGAAALASATPAGGGTLGAGIYYYLATDVTSHGECNGTGELNVTLNGTTTTATTLSFFGVPADGHKRRVYRGTASGVYDGFYELALNSDGPFTDTGAAFTGRRSNPASGVDGTNMTEPDANYGVWVTPSWGTTVKVTGKATTGFTATFGTPTPDSNQTLDWLIVRRLLERSYDGYQVGSRKGMFHQAGLRREDREPQYSVAP